MVKHKKKKNDFFITITMILIIQWKKRKKRFDSQNIHIYYYNFCEERNLFEIFAEKNFNKNLFI